MSATLSKTAHAVVDFKTDDYPSATLAELFAPPEVKAPRKGKRLRGSGWLLVPTGGRDREFRGTLLATVNHGQLRLAIFSVPKRRTKKARIA